MENKSLNRPKILVTGGAGYIGSHTVVELWNVGYEPVIVDDFSNAQPWMIERLRKLTTKNLKCYALNCCNLSGMKAMMEEEGQFLGIIHFAAYKSVSESVAFPEKYYRNNMGALENILLLKKLYNVPDLVFSSSATVYGNADIVPVTEELGYRKASSPYGATKQMGEELILRTEETGSIILRYFNPVGAHPSGLIGELPSGVPQNLIPYITQTAIGKRDVLQVYGTDYNTPDGTCIRDYIHVVDLAKAHVAALGRLLSNRASDVFNIGTGKGSSVQEVINAFEKISAKKLPLKYVERREGDIEVSYANCNKAKYLLRWEAAYSLEDALLHAWNWELSLHSQSIAA